MIGLAASLLAGSAVLAQPPAAPPAPPITTPAERDLSEGVAFLRREGYSEAAIAILARDDAPMRALMQRFETETQAIDHELSAAIRAPSPDPVRIATVLRRRDALVTEMLAVRTRHMIEVVEALPEADRRRYLRLFDPLPPPGPRPAPPAPPSPPPPPPPRR